MFCLEKLKEKGTAVALGYFDGIHIGHKMVLDRALTAAKEKDLVPVVLVFDIHPRKLVSGVVPPMLTSEEHKKVRLQEMGFTVVDFNFREGMNYEPSEFIEKILVKKLGAKAVSCGFDYHYGKGGKGNAETMRQELSERNIEFFSVEPVLLGDEVVSSTAIRNFIQQGEIEKANAMLGEYFSYDFEVKRGDGLGKTWGFPTINQSFPEDFIVPKFGVYMSLTKVDGEEYLSVTNVGVRPTVAEDSMRSETCILDFSGDLYGRRVQVQLVKFIREEKKFSDIDALKEAIGNDIEKAKKMYNEVRNNG
ncbi:MAG: bifunctional riboflavin kinase/FAD synthetase [Clostridia bacterium]|nr:bifunctional riboflavin kinase/FAD synthetase [Clostridia bacterium]